MAQAIHQVFESAGEEENGVTGWLEENIDTELALVTIVIRLTALSAVTSLTVRLSIL